MSYVAIEAYDGSDSDQCIALEVGDALTDVHALDEHWFIGYNEQSTLTGAFPKSTVQLSPGESDLPSQLPGSMQQTAIYTKVLKGGPGGLNTRKDDQKVRFGDVKFEHSISQQESVASWQDSSFEESFRDQLSNYDAIETKSNKNEVHEQKGTSPQGKYDEESKLPMFKHLMASTDRLIHSEKHEKKRIKALFGILFGVAIGILLFLLSVFSFGYSYSEAGIIVAVFTIILSLGLAFSTHCRCILALVFPSFLTGRGRAVLLSIILSLVLSHPIANITYNAKVTGSSMACIVEIAANQSREIQKQLVAPLADLAEYIDKEKSELRALSDKISGGFSAVRSALDKADQSVNDAQKKIDALENACRGTIQMTYSECASKCPTVFPECSDICKKLQELTASCNGFNITDFALTQAARNARKAIDEVVNYFSVDIQIHGEFNASANTSRSLQDIQKEVDEDIGQKASVISTVFKVLGKFLSLSLLLLFLQAFWYLRNYLAKDAYDNIYITKQFRQLDKDNEKKGLQNVLPLKKNEEDKYINTTAWMLNSTELEHCKISFIIVLLHFVMFLLVVLFDVSLWYILDLVKRHGDVDLRVEGAGKVNVAVEGKGQVADFYRIMIKGIDINYNYTEDIDIGACLPNAKEPAYEMIPVFIILYVVTTACVVLQGYGVRLRRKICSYYYPEQELTRLDYLHKKIRHKRVGFLKFIRQQIVSSHKEAQVKNQLRFSTWLAFRCPIMAKCLQKEGHLECTSCEEKESSFSHVQVTKCKGTSGGWSCDAAYCQECLALLSGVCPLCQTNEVVLRD